MLANQDAHRARLLEAALRLSYFTVGWNGVAGGTALIAAVMASSPALAAFALNAILKVLHVRHPRLALTGLSETPGRRRAS